MASTWIHRSGSFGALQLSNSVNVSSPGASFSVPTKFVSQNGPPLGRKGSFRWLPNLPLHQWRRILLQLSYLFLFVAISLYASVSVEDMAKKMARGSLPKSAQAIIHLMGTGTLEHSVPLVAQQTASTSKAKPRQQDWRHTPVTEKLPVVFFASHVPNEPNHPAMRVLRQARLTNDLVYLVGPRRHRHLQALNVTIEPKEEYNETIQWVQEHVGPCQLDVFKWWILRDFLARHQYRRCIVLTVQVMLYANASEWAAWMLPDADVALPVRWPSLQPPPLPSQYVSSAVSGHVGLWSLDAVSDFLDFWKVVLDVALFGGGPPGSLKLIGRSEYKEQNVLGWYTYTDCWMNEDIDPPCMAEKVVGITPTLAAKIRDKFSPKYQVDSLCQPRWCQNSTWSEFGLCVFDNNFSVTTPSRFFMFSMKDKCPTSKLYEHYDAWMGGAPKRTVQFLAVHFQGNRRDFLKLEDPDPAKSWGSSPF